MMNNIRAFVFASFLLGSSILVSSCKVIETEKQTASQVVSESNAATLGKELATHYLNKTPAHLDINLTLEQAQEVQNEFVKALVPSLGKIVGYKAGLTSQKAQNRFNVSEPVQGVLLEKMLLKNGAVVSSNFGTVPIFEGDLMVRVGSEDLNTAKTSTEALAALDAVIPFLELSDLVYAQDVKLDAAKIVAINVGARLGVLGEIIPLSSTGWSESLGKIEVIILNEAGDRLAEGESKALLGDPLKVVLWLRDSLQAKGISLKKGDLISLGTITNPMKVNSGNTIRVQYIGLKPNTTVEISVTFE